MATQTAVQFEITYTYRGEQRPAFTIEANSPEDALARFKTIKPGVSGSEVQEVRERKSQTKPKIAKIPVVLSPGKELNTGEYQSLLTYLRSNGYTLHLACKPEFEDMGRSEYREWTNGEELSNDSVKVYDNAYGREWFLIFQYSPDVSFPFPIIERGTGGGKGSPCGLHLRGRVEVCYAEVAEKLVRAGLRAA